VATLERHAAAVRDESFSAAATFDAMTGLKLDSEQLLVAAQLEVGRCRLKPVEPRV
jgi:hypothetical protein